MNIAVLGNAGSWYVADLRRAAEARGHRLTRADYRLLSASVIGTGQSLTASLGSESDGRLSLTECDAVIVRTMPPGSLEQVVFRMDALWVLENAGVQVLNPPRAIECAVDKYLCTARMASAGLPVPETIVCEGEETALAAFATLGGDVVVKPLFGAEGRGIVRVSDPDLALRTFRTLSRLGAVLYVQRYVPHDGSDLRLLILDGQFVAAMQRSNPHDFRTNVSRRATAAVYMPTDAEVELALRATQVAGARIAGVDLLYAPDGRCLVIEVNAVPGWRALRRVTGVDVAALVIDSLAGR